MSMVNWAKYDWYITRHHERYRTFIENHGLPCQACHACGGETVPVLDYGEGPFESCGFCEGTGKVTPHMRGLWLKWKREEKRERLAGLSHA